MPYEHCAWQQRLVCVSFLVTKLTQDCKSQTNGYWKSPHSVFTLSWCAEFGITRLFAGTNKTSWIALFSRLCYKARLPRDVNQSSRIPRGVTPKELAHKPKHNLLMTVQPPDSFQELFCKLFHLSDFDILSYLHSVWVGHIMLFIYMILMDICLVFFSFIRYLLDKKKGTEQHYWHPTET